jgi:hypothetical protein
MAKTPHTNDNGTVNPPMNQEVKLAAPPKTLDEKEFGPGAWVFSEALQRPIVTGTIPGPVSDRTLLDAKNVDEALAESRDKGLYTAQKAAGVTIVVQDGDQKVINGSKAKEVEEKPKAKKDTKADKTE